MRKAWVYRDVVALHAVCGGFLHFTSLLRSKLPVVDFEKYYPSMLEQFTLGFLDPDIMHALETTAPPSTMSSVGFLRQVATSNSQFLFHISCSNHRVDHTCCEPRLFCKRACQSPVFRLLALEDCGQRDRRPAHARTSGKRSRTCRKSVGCDTRADPYEGRCGHEDLARTRSIEGEGAVRGELGSEVPVPTAAVAWCNLLGWGASLCAYFQSIMPIARKGQLYVKEFMQKHCKAILIEDKDVPTVEQILREVAQFSGQFAEAGAQVSLARFHFPIVIVGTCKIL